MGKNCELDTSRGGASFQVADINDDNIKYTITYPVGVAFDFGDPTFWRALYALDAQYDQQKHQVTATVTLKGLGGHPPPSTAAQKGSQATFWVYSMCP